MEIRELTSLIFVISSTVKYYIKLFVNKFFTMYQFDLCFPFHILFKEIFTPKFQIF